MVQKALTDNVHFFPPRQTSSQMFLATKKSQLQLVSQRKRSYECSYLCLSPDCKISQILAWKNPEILSFSQKKNLLKCPHSFQNNCKLYFNTLPSSVPCRVNRQSCTRKQQHHNTFSCPPTVTEGNLAPLLPITKKKMEVSMETSPWPHKENYQLFLIRSFIRVYLFTEMFLSNRRTLFSVAP